MLHAVKKQNTSKTFVPSIFFFRHEKLSFIPYTIFDYDPIHDYGLKIQNPFPEFVTLPDCKNL